eukprot:m.114698 g.114698  ORF g.114698 m.114698 type:complete len:290 (+) comp22946_c0_seq4:29-898(+)
MEDIERVDEAERVVELEAYVQSLRKQNEKLKAKMSHNNSASSLSSLNSSSASMIFVSEKDPATLLDGVALIDLSDDEILGTSEDSWLYTSPSNPATPAQKSVTPQDWLASDRARQELDRVRSNLFSAFENCITTEENRGSASTTPDALSIDNDESLSSSSITPSMHASASPEVEDVDFYGNRIRRNKTSHNHRALDHDEINEAEQRYTNNSQDTSFYHLPPPSAGGASNPRLRSRHSPRQSPGGSPRLPRPSHAAATAANVRSSLPRPSFGKKGKGRRQLPATPRASDY